MGVELTNKIIGVIGAGNIGGVVCERARALKMKVIAYDPYLSEEKAKNLSIKKVELEEKKAAKEQHLAKKFTICSYCKSEAGSLHSAHSEPHYFTCDQRKLQCNTVM